MSEVSHRVKAVEFKKILSPYFGSELRRSIIQITVTVVPFLLFWYAAYRSLEVGYWLTLIMALPAGAFLMRMFMIQHDLGHGSYFKNQRVADLMGFWIGVSTLTPYRYWRKTHAYHHAHSGDLSFRGFGDILTRTLAEYQELNWLKKIHYRVYRNPFVLFGLGAMFHFVVKHRFPWDIPREWKREWAGIWKTNFVLLGVLALAHFTVGLGTFAAVHVPILVITTSVGVWLFYVQHQFEDGYWHWHEQWDYFDAGLHGSTHLVLPKPLQWVTANIGIHHVHHLSARIPNYKLQECLDANGDVLTATKITFWDGMKTLWLTLWDEESRELVSFRKARRIVKQQRIAA